MTAAMNAAQLAEWTPAHIRWEAGCPLVHWCYLGQDRFVEPFFEATIRRHTRTPFNLLSQPVTALDALAELGAADPGLPPTGFIFHMSRCGSTLAAQLLAALPQNIVISEAGPIDAVLRANWYYPNITFAQRVAWLRALLSAYARPHHGEQHFYVKFDSWHTLELPLIQAAFPNVPWIFLYREPVQVLVSHQRQRGSQLVPDLLPPQWLGLEPPSPRLGSPGESPGGFLDEYGARVLQRVCAAALQHLDARARLINYQQLPPAVWTEIAAHFGTEYSAADRAAMHQVAQFDAKNPGLTFSTAAQAKAQTASPELRLLAEKWLQPVYAALEARRIQQEREGSEHA
jgi:hypothetical protein